MGLADLECLLLLAACVGCAWSRPPPREREVIYVHDEPYTHSHSHVVYGAGRPCTQSMQL